MYIDFSFLLHFKESFSLFVGNLNSEKNFEELKKALNGFFTKKKLSVTDVRIGSTRKFGYVDFETKEQLEKALEFNGNKVLGLAVKLDKARSKESNADSKRDGIAYIEFESEAAANSALEQKQGTDVDGRAIVIDFTGDKNSDTLIVNNLAYSATEDTLQNIFAKALSIKIPEKNGRPIGKTLFVRGLSDETTEETLKEAFEGAESARIAMDRESGRSKGFGFVDFPSEEDAKLAKDAMEDGEIDGCKIMLDFARPKGDSQRGGRGGGFGRGRGGRGRFGGRGRGGRGGGRGGFG
eukprot:g38629.t1